MFTFQQIISRLSQFWEKQGCLIHQGHDLEMGAGTFNPATFLRCLGPEPYKTAYVEPSRRPSDGRYGENPNRVQLFHQYQVIIKPSPPDIQKMCVESFEAIGLKLEDHDIRFVHSDWEGPTLGAWGLGWEVWCDGMEICQFTYFQAMGSLPLKPVSAEITYGLERIAMFIQNVDSIFDIKWNDTLTFRSISKPSEVEWSTYNFTEASTDMWQRHFEDYEKEAKALVQRHLPIPAYDFVIKASHAFNILDARGVISVTERTGYIGRIRDLARLIAIEYLASREKEGYPLIVDAPQLKEKTHAKISGLTPFNPKKTTELLIEIGVEELPVPFVSIGCSQLEKKMKQLLETHRIPFEQVALYGTARRLAIHITSIAEGSCDKQIERKGPAIATAFNTQGALTPQGEGFFKACGISIPSLQEARTHKQIDIRTLNGTEYLFASLVETGVATIDLLAKELPHLILGMDFPKKMRWGDLDISYPRPLRWIVALLGKTLIPCTVGELSANRFTFGHAQLSPGKIELSTPSDYLAALRRHFVLADMEERRKSISSQLDALEKEIDSCALERERVTAEVLQLSEWPQLTCASFDAKFLHAPPEVLISEMVEHQKYFPIADKRGKLKNLFVITADRPPTDLIRKGNQKVLSARLADGVFLYEQDLMQPLVSLNEKLKIMTFQKELGSMFDKVKRIGSHAEILHRLLGIGEQKKIARAALLCKSDLASALVGEFPELQGIIGKTYALAQKEDEEVARAIDEHWMPKSENGPLPSTPTGIILSVADKIDNLLAYYSVGLKPSSSSDPYALKRQAFGILDMLLAGRHSLDLKELFKECSYSFAQISESLIDEILAFLTARAKSLFEEKGFKKDEIEACLRGVCTDPFDQFRKLQALHAFRSTTDCAKLLEVYKRTRGFLETPVHTPFDVSLAKDPDEVVLAKAVVDIKKDWNPLLGEKNYTKLFDHMAYLQPFLSNMLETVKILDDDPAIRTNRLALLQKIFSMFNALLDFSKLQAP